ncbi:hypothetical protein [Actinomyces ruminicola]|uniref:hypothetical protein n=1 Tax=Actinomyces ruminicola TaxID=332524 RepID=UPI00164F2280|nr:hypothetical protein [Actinomyces ruminicola]
MRRQVAGCLGHPGPDDEPQAGLIERFVEQATGWLVTLNDHTTQYKDWPNQRTTAEQDPQTAARTGRKWWQTHPRVRRAYRRLERLAKQGQPFAYLTGPDGKPRPTPAGRTTNPVESINSQVRDRLRHHRGATTDHQAAIAEWTLHTYTNNPAPTRNILADWHAQGRPKRTRTPKPKTTPTSARTHPAGWGTTPTPKEGHRNPQRLSRTNQLEHTTRPNHTHSRR